MISTKKFSYQRLATAADIVALLLAISIPWSTSATSVLAVIWVLTLLPTLTWTDIRKVLITPQGGLPVALVAFAFAGMLWANDVSWPERWGGWTSFLKLLAIPLFIIQFGKSPNGFRVVFGFLASCTALLAASYIYLIFPSLPKGSLNSGVPVKSYIVQSAEFTICAFILLFVAIDQRKSLGPVQLWAIVFLAFAFLLDLFFVATSRTTVVVLPILALLLGLRLFGWRGASLALAAAFALFTLFWFTSSYFHDRMIYTYENVVNSFSGDMKNPAGERLVFWQKSSDFIEAAPVIGNGTGSIKKMFRDAATGESGVRSEMSTNPHNQTLAVGIQLGVAGILLLWAMWVAHLMYFRVTSLVGWVGLVVVAQNVVGSVFNSFLFDFTEGWLYVVMAGTVAGCVASEQKKVL